MEYAKKHTSQPISIAAISTVTPRYPNTVIEMPNFATDSAPARRRGHRVPRFDHPAAYVEAGLGPDDVNLAEVYDLSSALELDWYENIGLCKPGEAERLLNDGDTTLGGRVRSIRAAAWHVSAKRCRHRRLRRSASSSGSCAGKPKGARSKAPRSGITVNQGLFGHGSSVIVQRYEARAASLDAT